MAFVLLARRTDAALTQVKERGPVSRHKGDTYCVHIHVAVPGGKHIDITRDPAATGRHEDAHVTIQDAFDAAGRRLQDQLRGLAS